MFQIEYYETEYGRSEVSDFLEDLRNNYNKKKYRIVYDGYMRCVEYLNKCGLKPNRPQIDKLRDEIWEMRPHTYRILFFLHKGSRIVLLSVFRKTTSPVPDREIDKAIKRKNDWERRNK